MFRNNSRSANQSISILAFVILAGTLLCTGSLKAQQTFQACYVPEVGVIYLINQQGLPTACVTASHVPFSWTEGAGGAVSDHGALTGLGDDDHPEYVRDGEAAGGDMTGTFPNPAVAALRGNPLSATNPTNGQILVWDGAAWVPQTPSGGGGGTSDHGSLTGLGDDDHVQYLLLDGVRDATDGFAVTGTPRTGTLLATGPGTRFLWHPAKGALRAGTVAGPVSGFWWDENNIGYESMAIGYNTEASGDFSVALGDNSRARAEYGFAVGYSSSALGQASVAGGSQTTASGDFSTAFGDRSEATGWGSFAGGGVANASGNHSVALGAGPSASNTGAVALGNGTLATGLSSTAMGLLTEANGSFSTSMGRSTVANGHASLAAGSYATAGLGSFIFGDFSTAGAETVITSPADHSFTARASGGVYFYSNSALTAGVTLAPGGGSWSTVSDRNLKENLRQEDGESVLGAIADMPVLSWNYKAQDSSIRHVGPMAQDFHSAFGLGQDDRHIISADIDGINMLGIQALISRTEALRAENEDLSQRVDELEAALLRLEVALAGRR